MNGAITEHVECDVIRVRSYRSIGATVLCVPDTQTFWGFVAVVDDPDVLVRVMNDDPRVQTHLGIFVCDPDNAVGYQQILVLELGDISVTEPNITDHLEVAVHVDVATRHDGIRGVLELDRMGCGVPETSHTRERGFDCTRRRRTGFRDLTGRLVIHEKYDVGIGEILSKSNRRKVHGSGCGRLQRSIARVKHHGVLSLILQSVLTKPNFSGSFYRR